MVETKGKIRVFVYGSLKKGRALHPILERGNAEYVGRNYIEEKLRLVDFGRFPGLVDVDEERRTFGEVYTVCPETLASIDMAEGHPNFFTRVKVWTQHEPKLKAWTYVLTASANDYAEEWVHGAAWLPNEEEIAFVEGCTD